MITLGRIREFHKALENATVIPQEYEEFLQEIDGTIAECESNPEQAEENELKSYYTFREIFHIIFYACWPLAKIEEAIKFLVDPNMKDSESFNAPQYSTDILFDKLNNLYEFQKEVIIRSIASGDAFCYDALLQTIKGGSKDEFVEFIHNNRCRTDKASALCWYYNSFDALELKTELETIDDDPKTTATLFNIYSENVGNYLGGEYNNSMDTFANMFSSFMQIVDNFENEGFVRLTDTINAFINNELLSCLKNLYRNVMGSFSDEPKVCKVIEQIKTHPEVAEYFKAWDEEYLVNKKEKNTILANNEKALYQQEENAHKQGRKKECWMTIKYAKLSEEDAENLIETKIWNEFRTKYLEHLLYPKIYSKGRSLDTAIRGLGASMILFAAQNVGIAENAKVKDNKNVGIGVTPSFMRSMQFLRIPINTVKSYWLIMKQYEALSGSKRKEERFKSFQDTDSNKAEILSMNFHQFPMVISWIEERLSEEFENAVK